MKNNQVKIFRWNKEQIFNNDDVILEQWNKSEPMLNQIKSECGLLWRVVLCSKKSIRERHYHPETTEMG